MPRVINCRRERPPVDAVYVGRPSKWGNPFPATATRTREQAIAQHKEWLLKQPNLMIQIEELRGKDLVCYCAPLPCHGDLLLELANKD